MVAKLNPDEIETDLLRSWLHYLVDRARRIAK
jgi:hypothetical protein